MTYGIYDFIHEENTDSVLGYFVNDENLNDSKTILLNLTSFEDE